MAWVVNNVRPGMLSYPAYANGVELMIELEVDYSSNPFGYFSTSRLISSIILAEWLV